MVRGNAVRVGAGDSHSPTPQTLYGGTSVVHGHAQHHNSRRNYDSNCTTILLSGASYLKSSLVDIGLDALSHGDWLIVTAVTTLIHKRQWTHV
jgi:hypothetical protein